MEKMNNMQDGYDIIQDDIETDGTYLTFWTDDQLFAVPITEVVQIVGLQHITEIPEYPSYAKGIINLRGNIIPLIDIRLRLSRAEKDYDDRTCIIVSNVQDHYFGFIVDSVDEVTDIPDDKISPPPSLSGDVVNRYITGVARLTSSDGHSEHIVLTMDFTKILVENEFNMLASSVQSEE